MNSPTFLSDAEVAELCAPLKQGAAQRAFLDRVGMRYITRPNGRPIVFRASQAPASTAAGPHRGALLERLKRGRR